MLGFANPFGRKWWGSETEGGKQQNERRWWGWGDPGSFWLSALQRKNIFPSSSWLDASTAFLSKHQHANRVSTSNEAETSFPFALLNSKDEIDYPRFLTLFLFIFLLRDSWDNQCDVPFRNSIVGFRSCFFVCLFSPTQIWSYVSEVNLKSILFLIIWTSPYKNLFSLLFKKK